MDRLRNFRADLHVHTVLSPCAEVEMIPPLIVAEALTRQIDLIAITDHNAAGNIHAVQQAAAGTNLTVLPGMELQTKEEVHILCLFDELNQINEFQELISAHLPTIKNRIDFFGEQFVVDETGDFIKREEQLLITSTDLTIDQAWQIVDRLGGLFIPAHVNRKANGLLEILGLVPANIPFTALEISRHLTPQQAYQRFPQISGFPLIQSGDVHRLEEFIGTTIFHIEKPTIAELKMAFSTLNGRSVSIQPNLKSDRL